MTKLFSKCCGAEVKKYIYYGGFMIDNEVEYECLKCKKKPCKVMTEEEYINARENCPERNN